MLPARIKRLRRRLGLTQAGFADRLAVSVDTVKSWENDRTKPLGPAVIVLTQLESEKSPKVAGIRVDGKSQIV